MRAIPILAAFALLPGCFAVEPPDGAYQCATEGRPCPAGYDCLHGHCVRPGAEPDLAVELDMAEPPPDLARPIDAPDLAKPDLAVYRPDLSVPSREVCVVAQASSGIVVHRSSGDGNAAPLRTIAGVSTLLSAPTAIAVDLANKEIFVANPGTRRVIVFALAASADAAPLRYLDNIGTPIAVAVNPVDNELYVVNRLAKRIEVYARTASGTTPAPKRTLDLSLTSPTGLAYDHNSRELIVTDVASPYAVGVWDSLATGAPQARRVITGLLTQLGIPNAVAVDPKSGEIYVANSNGNTITVFAHTATGNAAPARTLSGLATGLNRPDGVALDTASGVLAVGNNASGNLGSLAFFEITASGNKAPLRAITGAATELLGPFGVAYCSN